MKISLCNEMFQRWSLENQFEAFASWGYDGTELAPFTLDPSLQRGQTFNVNLSNISESIVRRIHRISQRTGVVVSGFHWILAHTSGLHLVSSDKQVQENTTCYLAHLIRLCSELHGSYIVLGSPKQRNIPPTLERSEAEQNAVKVIEPLLPILEKHNVNLAIEPLAPSETNFLTNSEETIDFITRLGNPQHVCVHLDCKAMAGGEYQSIPEVIERVNKTNPIATFHANDPNLQGPGFGTLDFHPIIHALQKALFHGWIGIEPFDYTPGITKLGNRSISYLRGIIENKI